MCHAIRQYKSASYTYGSFECTSTSRPFSLPHDLRMLPVPGMTLLMPYRMSSIWYSGISSIAAVCNRGSSQAAVTERQALQPLCCAGRRYSACQHKRIPAVPSGHSVPGRDLCVVPHVCSSVIRGLLQRSAGLHHEVLALPSLQYEVQSCRTRTLLYKFCCVGLYCYVASVHTQPQNIVLNQSCASCSASTEGMHGCSRSCKCAYEGEG